MTPPDAHGTAVLGGSGFLGRHICAALRHSGARVVSVARRPAPGFASVRADLAREPVTALSALLRRHRIATVVNAAGAVWGYDTAALQESNVRLVERLREAAAAVPWRLRFVQIGTVFEYAPPRYGQRLTEKAPLQPSTAYGASKLQGGETVLAATADGLWDGLVLRATTCIGPGQPAEGLLGRVEAALRTAHRAGGTAHLRLTPLSAERDVVDCRDLAAAVTAAAASPAAGCAVNIGSGSAVPVRRLVDLLVTASGVPARIVEEGPATGRSAGIDWLAVDTGRAGELLGWHPSYSRSQTVRDMWSEAITNAEEGPD
ncbi:NAD(P)-dependent oxidoreductase [Streptomyces tubbatahanensis]|uniref:NAD(P)-dependent oxidoreductase n=1 Tax=Streptomyces tubbatahanensis TaxID=2923272 RepID=A0ABY3Y230_9ACTN|nr:NAD(P)-dependent oxidoreductase [Streptomyces tubbatahanensis]UNT00808.1 NAD(P)-dependent oxidoreductase [Streptomyces tubbatahanensis]